MMCSPMHHGLSTPTPDSVDRAIGYVRDWLAQPNVMFLRPGPRHLDIAFNLLTELGSGANLAFLPG